ncbi:MAG: hypothetical protein VX003_10430, partial [SAR324 cluster bacterium]|nr:hypothetical protein [SAR324 cluster bacterium]
MPQITLSGHPLEVVDISSGAGTSWKAVYQVQPGDSGEVSFTIDYKDLASNEGIQKTGDDLSNKMVIDTQLPTVLTTGISIQSSNTIAAVDGLKWARKDENIKLIFNTSEHVFSPKVNIAGVEINAFPRDFDTTGTQWEATYRVENILGDLLESTNLVLRLDASNIDGNRNRGFSEGDQISNWMDLSSKGYTLNRSHNLRPTFSSTGMNGKPAVQFNGNSNLYVENFTSLSTDDYTILAVSQLKTSTGDHDLLSITRSSGHALLIEKTSWNGSRWRFLHRMPVGGSGGSNRYGFASDTLSHLMLVERKSNGSEIDEMNFFIDDTINPDEANNNTSLLDNPNFDSGDFYLTLGSIDFNNMARPFNGSISELMIFNRGLTDLEKAVLLRHISEKWELDSVVDSDMDGTKDDMEGDEVEWAFIEVKDQAGNLVDLTSAPQSTSDGSKVQIDASHPEILEVSITSSNANSNLAKEGDNLTLTFKVSEPIRGPTSTEVTIDQVGSLDFEKIDSHGMEWQAKTSISSGLSDNASISLQIYDAAGNPSDLVVQTTDSSYVTFDTTIPTITIDSLTSDNAKTFLAKSGDQLTLNFTSSETILTPQIIIAGASADAVNASGDGLNWEVNTKVLDNTSNGLVDFEISFKDPAGNSGNKLCSAPTSYCGTSLNVDTSTPILELVRIQSNNDNTSLAKFRDTVTLEFDASEII